MHLEPAVIEAKVTEGPSPKAPAVGFKIYFKG